MTTPECSALVASALELLYAHVVKHVPMRLLGIPQPFDPPDFVFEPKIEGVCRRSLGGVTARPGYFVGAPPSAVR